MRAPGHLQGMFASESHMDVVAKRLNMDPIEFRRMNFMHDGDPSPLGHVIPHIKATETLGARCRSIGVSKPKKKNSGRGCAVGDWVSKGGESYALHARSTSKASSRYRPRSPTPGPGFLP